MLETILESEYQKKVGPVPEERVVGIRVVRRGRFSFF